MLAVSGVLVLCGVAAHEKVAGGDEDHFGFKEGDAETERLSARAEGAKQAVIALVVEEVDPVPAVEAVGDTVMQ